jgi:hypothetical protein
MLDREAELDQGLHQPVRAQHCAGELEERVPAGVQGFVELDPKAGQDVQCLACGSVDGETHTQRPFLRARVTSDVKHQAQKVPQPNVR